MAEPHTSILRALAALAGLGLALAAVAPRPAAAAEPAKPAAATEPAKPADAAKPAPEDDVEPDAGTRRAAAPDDRRGHVYFGVSGIAVGPAGSMAPNTPGTALSQAGFGFGGFFGVGLGRHATIQVFGDRTFFLGPAACSDGCSGRGYSLGLGLTYHLAQGLAFDPWASFGVAYRNSSFLADPKTKIAFGYQGIDVARLAIGGDFYPTPFFGFGPYLEADIGTNFLWHTLGELPPDVKNGPRTYAFFSVGVRIAFDPLRKAAPGATTTGRRGGGLAAALGLPGF